MGAGESIRWFHRTRTNMRRWVPPLPPATRLQVLESIEVAADLIAATTTSKGLTVQAELDPAIYEKGIKVSDHELEGLPIEKNKFHGERNYTVKAS
jgi:hypothetical protein